MATSRVMVKRVSQGSPDVLRQAASKLQASWEENAKTFLQAGMCAALSVHLYSKLQAACALDVLGKLACVADNHPSMEHLVVQGLLSSDSLNPLVKLLACSKNQQPDALSAAAEAAYVVGRCS
eukprot:2592055-Amphidinium_carterae.1